MLILQLLPTISYGDAVSNDTLALETVIQDMGYKTNIYAESIDVRLPKGTAKPASKMPKLHEDDIVIYHLSTGAHLNWDFGKLNCRKIMVYHNVTPPEFLYKYNEAAAVICGEGLRAAKWLADGNVDYCIAASKFNKSDLENLGFICNIDVLPILIPFSDYDKKPNELTIRRLKDGYTNILFTGRIAPNKKQEDVIKAFAYYKKYYNHKSRLILVGSSGGYENYEKRLKSYVNQMELDDVIFPGHIKFDEILSYYHLADVFLCQSEHEGFCVPLVEAMYFHIPIIAYDSSAIADTLGGSGVLLENKNPIETAAMINRIMTDQELREKVIKNQDLRIQDFSHDKIETKFRQLLTAFIDQK